MNPTLAATQIGLERIHGGQMRATPISRESSQLSIVLSAPDRIR
jgi:hypothetical protein